ncbi:MAG: phosphoglycerate dehydrogenase [Cyclobacteriaceae bacterium]|nr:phosphoglycerate dehydrogenase [Cyclobacteriaceae bacterium]MDH4295643.1 phosphoglycerate dehydrogenase [Cyclobacteriaceae bacterium]MDH5249889.1 phosphoglycerate dehydrogenase [Cyclobacteriaceae bacterium]
MSTLKCLVIDAVHDSLFSMLAEIGWEADYQPDISRNQIKAVLSGYAGLILRSKTNVDQDLLGEHPNIKFVGRAGAGLDMLDMKYLTDKGIAVLHASEGNRDAVGEFTVGLLLSLLRNIPKADRGVKEFIWDREGNRGEEIMGKTVGIIGYGNMGNAFARRLAGFECNVLAFDKYKTGFSDKFCKEVQMNSIEEEADILSLHIPLTLETRNLVNLNYLTRFKKRIILINTARGEIVSLSDLAEMMDAGRVRGAALDVLENEKLDKLTNEQLLAFNLLRNRPNVVFTPHVAGWTFDSHIKINVALVQKIKALQLA